MLNNILLSFSYIRTLKLILLLVFLQHSFKKLIPIPQLNAIVPIFDDLLILIVFFIIINSILIKSKIFYIIRTPFNIWILIILFVFFISAFLNNVPSKNIILAFKSYFIMFFLYYIIVFYKYWTLEKIKKVFAFIYLIFSFELFLQIIQFSIGIVSGNANDDTATGTFAGANDLSYAYFGILFFVSYMYFFEKEKSYLKYIILFATGMVISFGEFAILMFPFLFISLNIKKIIKIKNLVKLLLIGSVFLTTVGMLYKINPQETVSRSQGGVLSLFSPQHLIAKFTENEFNVYSGSARFLWYPITIERLNQYSYHPLIGMGPGMYASYPAFTLQPEPAKSIYNIFGQLEKGVDTGVDSQIIPIMGEMGYIGLALVIAFLIYLFFKFRKVKSTDSFERGIITTASAMSLYLLIGLGVNHVIESQTFMLMFILVTSFATVIQRKRKFENINY